MTTHPTPDGDQEAEARKPYQTPAISLGRPRLPNLDNISEVLDQEGDERVEIEPAGCLPGSSAEAPLLRMVDLAVPTGIPDLAAEIDHHLYGHPKAESS